MAIRIQTPLTSESAKALCSGDEVLLTGFLYTGRDAAHKRMIELLDQGKPLPFELENQIIYYVGPCPASPGRVIGSAGPTTSGRMDAYAPRLLAKGLKGMIGKGLRDEGVVKSVIDHGAVYLGATGGAGALLASCIKSQEIVAFEDLGTEAIRRLWVEDFPCVVIIDAQGRNLYEEGRKKYAL